MSSPSYVATLAGSDRIRKKISLIKVIEFKKSDEWSPEMIFKLNRTIKPKRL